MRTLPLIEVEFLDFDEYVEACDLDTDPRFERKENADVDSLLDDMDRELAAIREVVYG